jgi:hypothetical protein
MTGPPAARPIQPPGTNPASATPVPKRRYDVRSADGRRLLFEVTAEEGARGIAERVFILANARSGAYLKRTADREMGRPSWGGTNFTRPVRGDGTCKTYQPGQLMGDRKRLREFIPVRSGK